MPQTILIGGWSVFAETHGLYKKEKPDTFEWMSDLGKPLEKICYEDVRQAVAKVEGALSWLMIGHLPGPESLAMEDLILKNMSSEHKSFALNQYRLSLRSWDSWVLDMKTIYLASSYKSRQIKPERLRWFLNDTYHTFGMTEALTITQNLAEHKIKFSDGSVPTSWAELKALTSPLMTEFKAAQDEEEQSRRRKILESSVDMLELNYKNPSRWFWPGGCNPIYNPPSAEMMEVMEQKIPGYREHFAKVRAEFAKTGVIQQVRSLEAEKNLHAHLVKLGIAST